MPDVHVITRNMTPEQLDNLRLSELSDLLNQYSLKKPHTESTKTRCYRVCERFARKFLRVKKPYRNEDEYEGMSITVAEEIYLLILSNKIVTNWIAYANAAYKGWIEIWANLNNISFNKPSININKYYDPNGPRRYASMDVNTVIDHIEIQRILKNLYKDVNRYIRYSKRWSDRTAALNAKISMMLSIQYKHFVNFRLNDRDAALCRLLYNKYKQHASTIIHSTDIPILSDKQYASSMVGEIFQMNGITNEEEN